MPGKHRAGRGGDAKSFLQAAVRPLHLLLEEKSLSLGPDCCLIPVLVVDRSVVKSVARTSFLRPREGSSAAQVSADSGRDRARIRIIFHCCAFWRGWFCLPGGICGTVTAGSSGAIKHNSSRLCDFALCLWLLWHGWRSLAPFLSETVICPRMLSDVILLWRLNVARKSVFKQQNQTKNHRKRYVKDWINIIN